MADCSKCVKLRGILKKKETILAHKLKQVELFKKILSSIDLNKLNATKVDQGSQCCLGERSSVDEKLLLFHLSQNEKYSKELLELRAAVSEYKKSLPEAEEKYNHVNFVNKQLVSYHTDQDRIFNILKKKFNQCAQLLLKEDPQNITAQENLIFISQLKNSNVSSVLRKLAKEKQIPGVEGFCNDLLKLTKKSSSLASSLDVPPASVSSQESSGVEAFSNDVSKHKDSSSLDLPPQSVSSFSSVSDWHSDDERDLEYPESSDVVLNSNETTIPEALGAETQIGLNNPSKTSDPSCSTQDVNLNPADKPGSKNANTLKSNSTPNTDGDDDLVEVPTDSDATSSECTALIGPALELIKNHPDPGEPILDVLSMPIFINDEPLNDTQLTGVDDMIDSAILNMDFENYDGFNMKLISPLKNSEAPDGLTLPETVPVMTPEHRALPKSKELSQKESPCTEVQSSLINNLVSSPTILDNDVSKSFPSDNYIAHPDGTTTKMLVEDKRNHSTAKEGTKHTTNLTIIDKLTSEPSSGANDVELLLAKNTSKDFVTSPSTLNESQSSDITPERSIFDILDDSAPASPEQSEALISEIVENSDDNLCQKNPQNGCDVDKSDKFVPSDCDKDGLPTLTDIAALSPVRSFLSNDKNKSLRSDNVIGNSENSCQSVLKPALGTSVSKQSTFESVSEKPNTPPILKQPILQCETSGVLTKVEKSSPGCYVFPKKSLDWPTKNLSCPTKKFSQANEIKPWHCSDLRAHGNAGRKSSSANLNRTAIHGEFPRDHRLKYPPACKLEMPGTPYGQSCQVFSYCCCSDAQPHVGPSFGSVAFCWNCSNSCCVPPNPRIFLATSCERCDDGRQLNSVTYHDSLYRFNKKPQLPHCKRYLGRSPFSPNPVFPRLHSRYVDVQFLIKRLDSLSFNEEVGIINDNGKDETKAKEKFLFSETLQEMNNSKKQAFLKDGNSLFSEAINETLMISQEGNCSKKSAKALNHLSSEKQRESDGGKIFQTTKEKSTSQKIKLPQCDSLNPRVFLDRPNISKICRKISFSNTLPSDCIKSPASNVLDNRFDIFQSNVITDDISEGSSASNQNGVSVENFNTSGRIPLSPEEKCLSLYPLRQNDSSPCLKNSRQHKNLTDVVRESHKNTVVAQIEIESHSRAQVPKIEMDKPCHNFLASEKTPHRLSAEKTLANSSDKTAFRKSSDEEALTEVSDENILGKPPDDRASTKLSRVKPSKQSSSGKVFTKLSDKKYFKKSSDELVSIESSDEEDFTKLSPEEAKRKSSADQTVTKLSDKKPSNELSYGKVPSKLSNKKSSDKEDFTVSSDKEALNKVSDESTLSKPSYDRALSKQSDGKTYAESSDEKSVSKSVERVPRRKALTKLSDKKYYKKISDELAFTESSDEEALTKLSDEEARRKSSADRTLTKLSDEKPLTGSNCGKISSSKLANKNALNKSSDEETVNIVSDENTLSKQSDDRALAKLSNRRTATKSSDEKSFSKSVKQASCRNLSSESSNGKAFTKSSHKKISKILSDEFVFTESSDEEDLTKISVKKAESKFSTDPAFSKLSHKNTSTESSNGKSSKSPVDRALIQLSSRKLSAESTNVKVSSKLSDKKALNKSSDEEDFTESSDEEALNKVNDENTLSISDEKSYSKSVDRASVKHPTESTSGKAFPKLSDQKAINKLSLSDELVLTESSDEEDFTKISDKKAQSKSSSIRALSKPSDRKTSSEPLSGKAMTKSPDGKLFESSVKNGMTKSYPKIAYTKSPYKKALPPLSSSPELYAEPEIVPKASDGSVAKVPSDILSPILSDDRPKSNSPEESRPNSKSFKRPVAFRKLLTKLPPALPCSENKIIPPKAVVSKPYLPDEKKEPDVIAPGLLEDKRKTDVNLFSSEPALSKSSPVKSNLRRRSKSPLTMKKKQNKWEKEKSARSESSTLLRNQGCRSDRNFEDKQSSEAYPNITDKLVGDLRSEGDPSFKIDENVNITTSFTDNKKTPPTKSSLEAVFKVPQKKLLKKRKRDLSNSDEYFESVLKVLASYENIKLLSPLPPSPEPAEVSEDIATEDIHALTQESTFEGVEPVSYPAEESSKKILQRSFDDSVIEPQSNDIEDSKISNSPDNGRVNSFNSSFDNCNIETLSSNFSEGPHLPAECRRDSFVENNLGSTLYFSENEDQDSDSDDQDLVIHNEDLSDDLSLEEPVNPYPNNLDDFQNPSSNVDVNLILGCELHEAKESFEPNTLDELPSYKLNIPSRSLTSAEINTNENLNTADPQPDSNESNVLIALKESDSLHKNINDIDNSSEKSLLTVNKNDVTNRSEENSLTLESVEAKPSNKLVENVLVESKFLSYGGFSVSLENNFISGFAPSDPNNVSLLFEKSLFEDEKEVLRTFEEVEPVSTESSALSDLKDRRNQKLFKCYYNRKTSQVSTDVTSSKRGGKIAADELISLFGFDSSSCESEDVIPCKKIKIMHELDGDKTEPVLNYIPPSISEGPEKPLLHKIPQIILQRPCTRRSIKDRNLFQSPISKPLADTLDEPKILKPVEVTNSKIHEDFQTKMDIPCFSGFYKDFTDPEDVPAVNNNQTSHGFSESKSSSSQSSDIRSGALSSQTSGCDSLSAHYLPESNSLGIYNNCVEMAGKSSDPVPSISMINHLAPEPAESEYYISNESQNSRMHFGAGRKRKLPEDQDSLISNPKRFRPPKYESSEIFECRESLFLTALKDSVAKLTSNEREASEALNQSVGKNLDESSTKELNRIFQKVLGASMDNVFLVSNRVVSKLRHQIDLVSPRDFFRFIYDQIFSDETPFSDEKPYMSKLVLSCAAFTMAYIGKSRNQFLIEVLKGAEEILGTYHTRSLDLSTGVKLTAYYTVLCKAYKLEERIKLTIYDIVYSKKGKAYGLVYMALLIYPELLVNQRRCEASDCLLTRTIVRLLLTSKDSFVIRSANATSFQLKFNSVKLRELLRLRYGYSGQNFSFSVNDLASSIIQRLSEEGSQRALILLCQFEAAEWSRDFVLKKLCSLLQGWADGNIPEYHFARGLLFTTGSITRGLPVEMGQIAVENILSILEKILRMTTDPSLIEGIVEGVSLLRRHNLILCASLLMRYTPSSGLITKRTLAIVRRVTSVLSLVKWLRIFEQERSSADQPS